MSAKRAKPAPEPGEPLAQALRAVVAGLAASGRPSMIIGGVAVIARGVTRLTRDIDATVAGAGTDVEALLGILARHGIVPRIEDAARFAAQSHVLLLRHAPSGIDVDLSVAWLPFEIEAIAASDVLPLHGARAHVARAEDLVIYKVAAWRPQDRQDVERLVALHRDHMDLDRVRGFARELATVLEEPQRVEELEKVLAPRTASGTRAPAPARSRRRTPRGK